MWFIEATDYRTGAKAYFGLFPDIEEAKQYTNTCLDLSEVDARYRQMIPVGGEPENES